MKIDEIPFLIECKDPYKNICSYQELIGKFKITSVRCIHARSIDEKGNGFYVCTCDKAREEAIKKFITELKG